MSDQAPFFSWLHDNRIICRDRFHRVRIDGKFKRGAFQPQEAEDRYSMSDKTLVLILACITGPSRLTAPSDAVRQETFPLGHPTKPMRSQGSTILQGSRATHLVRPLVTNIQQYYFLLSFLFWSSNTFVSTLAYEVICLEANSKCCFSAERDSP